MKSQGDAVFQAVRAVFPEGAVPPTTDWSPIQKTEVHAYVLESFKSGETSHRKNPTEAELIKYIPGLVNNWVRKDKRLNGGMKYTPKRPGSRAGSGDEMVRNMKLLLSATSDPAVKQQIQAEIDKRVSELKPKAEINVDALPEALRHLVS
jgi:hypothetical protein